MLCEAIGIVALLLGLNFYNNFLEARAKNNANESIAQHPKGEYVVMRNGFQTTISEDDILIGDLIYLKYGMKCPIDGLMV